MYTICMTTKDGTFDVTDHDHRGTVDETQTQASHRRHGVERLHGHRLCRGTPKLLGSIEYQVLNQQELAQVVGQGGGALAGGGVDSWRTIPPVSVNGTKIGAGVEI